MSHVVWAYQEAAAVSVVLKREKEGRSAVLFSPGRNFPLLTIHLSIPVSKLFWRKTPGFVDALDTGFDGSGTRTSGRYHRGAPLIQIARR